MIKFATVWGQDNCVYCDRAKAYLEKNGYTVHMRKIDGITITKEDLAREVPGARSVPQIFINDKYIGGYNELLQVTDL